MMSRDILKRIPQFLSNRYLVGIIFIVISIIVGMFLAGDYGISYDESGDINYGEAALGAYSGSEDYLWMGDRKYYGPAYWMFVNLIVRLFTSPQIDFHDVYIWKTVSFLVFQVGVLSFYYLCRRFVPRIPALITTGLFMTQPLLWGHAFINQKDIPIMSFFLLSVVLCLKGIDGYSQYIHGFDHIQFNDQVTLHTRWTHLRKRWSNASSRQKTLIQILFIILVLSILELFIVKKIVLPLLQEVVRKAYIGESTQWINSLFETIAQDAYKTPVGMYIEKITEFYNQTRSLFLFFLVLSNVYFFQQLYYGERASIIRRRFFKGLSFFLIPGFVLGLTISIRITGLSAGALISGYFLYRLRQKAFVSIAFIWCVAAFVVYCTWPFLWDDPLARLLESIQVAGSFSHHGILFQGSIYGSANVPVYYLPLLLSIQLTEPAVICILFGIFIYSRKLWKKENESGVMIVIGLWAFIPILANIILHIPIYDNFRQLLFIVPPLFIISGLAISHGLKRGKNRGLLIIVILILLLPGIIGIINLHPYQYVYYNTIVGGIDNAYQVYEMEYWCTSLRETILFLNLIALSDSRIVIYGPVEAASPYARDDLKLIFGLEGGPWEETQPDYVIGCRNVYLSEDFYPDYETIYEVTKDSTIFAVVKKRFDH